MTEIPDELVELAAQRRLIPFLGAGFSSGLGLPTWESMLKSIASELDEEVDFSDLLEATNHDYLQVAEYLYLQHDRQIGPIRHEIERSFGGQAKHAVESSAHVELVNLHAPQIYTTNYDDLVEQAFKSLNEPFSRIILPKDVALADSEKTQIVKYHGDLSHERTLVLTESAYYKRLDFESPMDLKFRSDLLGKSVLFMGYSFRDINIRIIWFKLMEMMKDIPESDRRPSYIVRLSPNPVLEKLYEAVGLKTIVLNSSNREEALGQFLYELSARAFASTRSFYVSNYLLDYAERISERMPVRRPGAPARLGFSSRAFESLAKRVLSGRVPDALRVRWLTISRQLLLGLPVNDLSLSAAVRLAPSVEVTTWIVSALAANGSAEARREKRRLLHDDAVWTDAWKGVIARPTAFRILYSTYRELDFQTSEGVDEDLIFLIELCVRLRDGQLKFEAESQDDHQRIVSVAAELVDVGAELYVDVNMLRPDGMGAPDVAQLLAVVDATDDDFSFDLPSDRLHALGKQIEFIRGQRPTRPPGGPRGRTGSS